MSLSTFSEIEQEIEKNFQQVVSWRRHLHIHPELSFQESATAAFIKDQLISFGYEHISSQVGGHGVIATLNGSEPGPSIALRADFDALAMQDEKEVDYRSQNPGVTHACGHDGHTAALLGTAKTLLKYKQHLKGKVIFIFQPAEEVPPGGAKAMIEEGVLEGVDYIYGIHLDSSIPVGKVAVGSGYRMAAVDKFAITVKGNGGHGAAPHHTTDPIAVGSELVNALQKIVSRQTNPLDAAVVSIGVFQAGHAFNVIPDKAVLEGTVRSFDPEVRKQIKRSIYRIVEHITAGFEAGYEIEYIDGYPALYNHPVETEQLSSLFNQLFGNENVEEFPVRMGAEDFSYYLKEVPGSFFRVGSKGDDPATHFNHHHPKFDIDERALLIAQKAYIQLIYSNLAIQGGKQ
ncbi:M20 metallopeptidase family protein [Jeotgalibacillus haloalkalitolerans]|uniref:Amidohydrolase n=1 Tax=Jeotgalibacillus haloalkalitolerans TaxID=3104292 RepID=A0ABU5KP74_9BACL|nr:amidohydrolase [Jeotgalibacillus sp. HH7-29]MDZ5712766.1 amidohydrolase [Jeotgalibacillus sp. HH7-29]